MSTETGRNFNLAEASLLLAAQSPASLEILSEITGGFGARHIHTASSIEDARRTIGIEEQHLIIVDGRLEDGAGLDFVAWLRREAPEPNRYAPVIFASSNYTKESFEMARDAGVNFMVAKPVKPDALLKRILWLADNPRRFVEAGTYCGPDRRVRFEGPPAGLPGRRKEDLPVKLGAPAGDNLSQDAIDAFLKPQKMTL
ncbi:response regulator [Hyphobacterium sp. SN044]|uniref:response regulator n=1 Tax=Hyphobacterium sp. SN044 TaxID=2912575 RepID=UPI001F38C26E|nr:response regulator [Hyphobacterium sp. SN044]MCF8880090.1 response regulator [Hyphobacterium sp. SN044]